jgi:ABC-2 type transport system ATP-binding protein
MNCKGVSIEKLSVTRNGEQILNDISLRLEGEKNYLLFGRNGAGKSTLINCITGLRDDYEGVISIGAECQSILSFFSDEITAPNNTIVKKYINSFKLLYKRKGIYQELTYEKLQTLFEINSFADKSFYNLSKGMKKKVLLCITLMKRADIIILDEPFEGLDIITKKRLIQFLLDEINSKKTLLVSTHEVAGIYKSFDFLVGIKSGRITGVKQNDDDLHYEQLLRSFQHESN